MLKRHQRTLFDYLYVESYKPLSGHYISDIINHKCKLCEMKRTSVALYEHSVIIVFDLKHLIYTIIGNTCLSTPTTHCGINTAAIYSKFTRGERDDTMSK